VESGKFEVKRRTYNVARTLYFQLATFY